MSELTVANFAVSARLARETGILAGRLVLLLDEMFPRSAEAAEELRAVLRRVFAESTGGERLESFSGSVLDRRPSGEPHPLDRLAAALALSPAEMDLLLLAGMPEEHPALAPAMRALSATGEPRPSVSLAARLICRDARERISLRALLECGPLARSGAVILAGDGPFFECSLRPGEALWPALHGLDAWPRAVAQTGGPAVASGLDEWFGSVADAIAALRLGEDCIIAVTAESEAAAFDRAMALVEHSGRVPAGIALPAVTDRDLERLITLHVTVRGAVPVLRTAVYEGPGVPALPAFATLRGPLVACSRPGGLSIHTSRPVILASADRLTPGARRRMWAELLPDADCQALASRYPVEPAAAAQVAADLQFRARFDGAAPQADQVAASLRTRAGVSLTGGIKLIHPVATRANLVLNADRLAMLDEAVRRLEFQSRVLDDWGFLKGRPGARGVRMLFSGPPGTGKTLSAEVVAHDLKVDLLYVDLSRVLSKWIGETEKNLASVFDAAERAHAVLQFDEADALFGRRTEVSDAHDRYANLETAYLLSRLERFEGLAILSTNLRSNVDAAFIRRLEFVIDFEEPDREERYRIWQCHLPEGVELGDDVNLYELAALYPVVGGFIKNAAVAAGFLAAADGGPILRQHFLHAMQREYQKCGQAFPGFPPGFNVRLRKESYGGTDDPQRARRPAGDSSQECPGERAHRIEQRPDSRGGGSRTT